MANEPTPSSAITPATATTLSATFDIPNLHSVVVKRAGKPVRTTYAARPGSVLGDRELVQVRLEHRLDLRRARAPVEP